LVLHEKQVDKHPFPINTMELQQPKVLVRPHQVEATKGKKVVVGEAKPDLRGKKLTREVAYQKIPDGRETLKITVKDSDLGGKGRPRLSVGNHVSLTLQGFPPIATISLGNTTNSVAIEGYYCTETVIRLQFVCLLQYKICVAIFIFCVATS
jgi:hypothetical protein